MIGDSKLNTFHLGASGKFVNKMHIIYDMKNWNEQNLLSYLILFDVCIYKLR